jgi:hypothetical protein
VQVGRSPIPIPDPDMPVQVGRSPIPIPDPDMPFGVALGGLA